MPFIKAGGLFIRTNPCFSLGDPVQLAIKFLNEPDTHTISGKVVWITPKGAQGGKPPGIGVQFEGGNCRSLCNKIETFLVGAKITPTYRYNIKGKRSCEVRAWEKSQFFVQPAPKMAFPTIGLNVYYKAY